LFEIGERGFSLERDEQENGEEKMNKKGTRMKSGKFVKLF
jgi:hypothetical protein